MTGLTFYRRLCLTCKRGTRLRIDSHDAAEQVDVVRRVADLLGVQHDLLELTRLGETLDHFVGNVGPKVDGQSQGGVGRLDQVTQLLPALQLILLEPLLQKLLPSLGQDGATQLQALELVELALVQKNAEILQQGRRLAGLGGDLTNGVKNIGSKKRYLQGVSERFVRRGTVNWKETGRKLE